MTAKEFRRVALSLLEAAEGSHMGHADFRVRGKIFATLGPKEEWGMVKLTAAQQAELVGEEPEVFQPANGAWGRQGATIVQLKKAKAAMVRGALLAAWRNTAPRQLIREFDGE